MSPATAELIVKATAGYLGIGLLFAALFSARLAGRLDPAAARSTWGFRLLILPGAMFLWPLLAGKLLARR